MAAIALPIEGGSQDLSLPLDSSSLSPLAHADNLIPTGRNPHHSFHPWMFLVPAFVVLIMVAAWPLCRTIFFSFTDAELGTLDAYSFTGFDNYAQVLADPEWQGSLWNTIAFAGLSVSLETVFGLAIALILNKEFPGRFWVRTAVLVPWAIPTVVSAKMWGWMLHDIYGIINALLVGCGIMDEPKAWTATSDLAFYAVVVVDVWKTTPFMALMILAGLQMMPKECFEAAKVDGIHPLKLFTKVTLPLLMPTLIVAMIFRTLDALRIFDLVYVLTSGSPETMTLSVFARQQLFDFHNVGVGSAASTILFIIIACISVVYISSSRKVREGQAS